MNDTLLKKYLLYSLGFHCLIIVIGIILSHSTTIRHTFVVLGVHSKKKSLTLFKPFNVKPVVPQNNNLFAQRSVKSVPSVVKKIPEQKKAQPTKKAPTVKSSPTKPLVKQERATPGVSFEKDKQGKMPASTEQKKKELVKKELVKKAVSPQQEKKIVTPKKQEAKIEKKVDATKSESKELEIEEKAEQKNTPEQIDRLLEQRDDEPVAVVFTDRDIMLYQQIVQKEIGQRWQPPLGVPKGTQCTVRFEISDSGTVKNAELIRNSDVLIFDLSAVRSARTCTFMQCLWGKTFQVDFRQ